MRRLSIIMLTLLLLVLVGCNQPTNTASAAAPPLASATNPSPEPAKPAFANAQDDQQGYDGVHWGTKFSDFKLTKLDFCAFGCVADHGMVNDVQRCDAERLFGVPYEAANLTSGTSQLPKLDVLPNKFKIVMKNVVGVKTDAETGYVEYIFYDDKLVMVYSHIDVDSYDAVAKTLSSNFEELNPPDEGHWTNTIFSEEQQVDWTARLFKRGETNTRVYLLKERKGIARAACTLYIPNFYFNAILDGISEVQKAK